MNDGNLKTLSPSEAREQGRLGGIASGQARRERKRLRECLAEALTLETEYDGETMSNAEAVSIALIKKAKGGSVAAFREIRDSTEGKPRQCVEVEAISPEARAEVEAILSGIEVVTNEYLEAKEEEEAKDD